MGKSTWNRMVSIPIKSLTQEELKEAIHEWAEGSEELEKLLWTCYHKGLETGGCHVNEHGNYIQFAVEPATSEQLKSCLFAAEEYGFTSVQMAFGGNPFSGPNWYKTRLAVSGLIPSDVGTFYTNLTNALESENFAKPCCAFALMSDFAEIFSERVSPLEFVMIVRNHCEYEFRIIIRDNLRDWNYYDEFFGSFGMIQQPENEAPYPMTSWYINAFSTDEFYNIISNILNGVRNKWNLEIPAEIMPDMGFQHKALLMQKKFGYTPEGVKKMNDWINTNNRYGRTVNY